LGQLLDYSYLREDEAKMIMFLDREIDEKRIKLASSLSIAVVIQKQNNYLLLNPEISSTLTNLFTGE
jgi:hypothetical protein